MNDKEWLAKRFEENRARLLAVAYRMLGSLGEAEDALQEAWLRVNRSDLDGVENLAAWLVTVVARICLDMLRARKSRREEPMGVHIPEPIVSRENALDPGGEAQLADSVGLALLVVLEKLTPAERLAFVLHDMFSVSFREIAPILNRSPAATRQLASRARRRVRGKTKIPAADLKLQREVAEAFLAASRGGAFDALLALLDPDVLLKADHAAVPEGVSREFGGASVVAKQALAYSGRAWFAQPALINGSVGIVVALRGRLVVLLGLTIKQGGILEIDVVADRLRLRDSDVAVLEGG